jgi:hypothetical protein
MVDVFRSPATVAGGTVRTVPCIYCREPIAAETFLHWPSERRLLSASCTSCQRRVTLPDVTFRRWSPESGPPAADRTAPLMDTAGPGPGTAAGRAMRGQAEPEPAASSRRHR